MNVRLLFIYVEPSIYEGAQWAVFQPNDVQFHPYRIEEFESQNDIYNGRS